VPGRQPRLDHVLLDSARLALVAATSKRVAREPADLVSVAHKPPCSRDVYGMVLGDNLTCSWYYLDPRASNQHFRLQMPGQGSADA